MKTKLGENKPWYMYILTEDVLRLVSLLLETQVPSFAMLTATLAGIEYRIGLLFKAEENEFQHLLLSPHLPSYLRANLRFQK
jgi:hypothetical protein